MKVRVYYEDTDAGGIVYHANYIKFCERARSEMFFNSNLPKFSSNRHFVVTNIEANFINSAFLGDILEIKSKVLELKKASFIMLQEIYLKDKKIFEAKIKIAFLINKKVAKIDDQTLEFLLNFKV
ncbi:MAG: YbgC/FadM family acyl-CoA thioesterase [Campylobacter sp.]|nr:YbgC/FadM family acyl-CoA thioesterase [Campylobacter sp.]